MMTKDSEHQVISYFLNAFGMPGRICSCSLIYSLSSPKTLTTALLSSDDAAVLWALLIAFFSAVAVAIAVTVFIVLASSSILLALLLLTFAFWAVTVAITVLLSLAFAIAVNAVSVAFAIFVVFIAAAAVLELFLLSISEGSTTSVLIALLDGFIGAISVAVTQGAVLITVLGTRTVTAIGTVTAIAGGLLLLSCGVRVVLAKSEFLELVTEPA
jgi:hypothetical protein